MFGIQSAVNVLGGFLGTRNQSHAVAHDVANRSGEQRVVSAAEDQGIHASLTNRSQVLFGHLHKVWTGGDSAFHKIYKRRAGNRRDVDVDCCGECVVVGLGRNRGVGADYTDVLVAGRCHSTANRRLNNLYHWNTETNRVALSSVAKHSGRCRVTGDD